MFKSKFCKALSRHVAVDFNKVAYMAPSVFVCPTCHKGFQKVSNFVDHQKCHEIWKYLPEKLLQEQAKKLFMKQKSKRNRARKSVKRMRIRKIVKLKERQSQRGVSATKAKGRLVSISNLNQNEPGTGKESLKVARNRKRNGRKPRNTLDSSDNGSVQGKYALRGMKENIMISTESIGLHTKSIIKKKNAINKKPNDVSSKETISNESTNQRIKMKCSKCKKSFTKKTNLERHLRTCNRRINIHTQGVSLENGDNESKVFKCKYCSRCFVSLTRLQSHIGIHKGEDRPFSCEECPEHFETGRELRKHERTHGGLTQETSPEIKVIKKKRKRPKQKQPTTESNSEKIYSCTKCLELEVFPSRQELRVHMSSCHQGPRLHYACQECPEKFKAVRYLRDHFLEAHSKDLPFKCELCPKRFIVRSLLKRHYIWHDDKRPYLCATCHKGFKTITDLKRHVSRHTTERKFECSICNKFYKTKDDVTVHTAAVHSRPARPETKEVPCEICGRRFYDQIGLKNHTVMHTGSNEYPCETCGKILRSEKSLKMHIATHTGVGLHTCEICGVKSARISDFKRHLRTHIAEKLFSCNVCPNTYRTKYNLKIHQFKHSFEPLPYPCDHCDKAYSCLSVLTLHKTIKHGGGRPRAPAGSYVCSICGKECNRKRDLLRHEYIHTDQKPFPCDICSRSFTRKVYLKEHKRKHTGEKPFICELCNKGFISTRYLSQHMQTHTKIKLFKCSTCEKTLSSKRALGYHESRHNGVGEISCIFCRKTFSMALYKVHSVKCNGTKKPKVKSEKKVKINKSDVTSDGNTNTKMELSAVNNDEEGDVAAYNLPENTGTIEVQIQNEFPEEEVVPNNTMPENTETMEVEVPSIPLVAISTLTDVDCLSNTIGSSEESTNNIETILNDRVNDVMQQQNAPATTSNVNKHPADPAKFTISYQCHSPLAILATDLNL